MHCLCFQHMSTSLLDPHLLMHQLDDPPTSELPAVDDLGCRIVEDGSGEAENMCKLCLRVFPNSRTLKRHVTAIHGDRKFECHVCNSRFTTSTRLKRHALIHTGERPYTCRFCRKCFNQNSNLITHERIHTGEQSYKCKNCGRMFRHSTTFQKHLCS